MNVTPTRRNAEARASYQLPTNQCEVSNAAGSSCQSAGNCAQCQDNRECRGGWCQCFRYSNGGAVYIFRGGEGETFDLIPDFVYWLPRSNAYPEILSGGFDLNGDGFGDIIVGAYRWDGTAGNDTGGVTVVTGRPAETLNGYSLFVTRTLCTKDKMPEINSVGV